MKKFVRIAYHDYMDMHPTYEVRVMEEEKILPYVEHMQKHWCSGTTTLVGELTKEEVVEHLCKTLKECLMDTKWPDSENIEEASRIFNKEMFEEFFECYGRDHINS